MILVGSKHNLVLLALDMRLTVALCILCINVELVTAGGITKFMNIPSPMTKNNYNKINFLLKDAAKTIAKKTMCDAAGKLTMLQM